MMITFQTLLFNHQARTSAIIDRYIAKYEDLEHPVNVYTWNLFLLENAKDVIAELSQSAIDVFHEAINSTLNLNRDDFNSIRGVNLGAAARYQEELRVLYETIVRTEKQRVQV
jgi:hypothetical protein